MEEAIFNLALCPSAGALGNPGHAVVPVFTNCPKTGVSLIETYNFDKLVQEECYNLTGHSKWFDVKFRVDGTINARGSPCGNHDDSKQVFGSRTSS